jgi:hypothetical protein
MTDSSINCDSCHLKIIQKYNTIECIKTTLGGVYMELANIKELAQSIRENVSRVIVGKEEIIDLYLLPNLIRHVLLERCSGMGKTFWKKHLPSLDCILKDSFTPDCCLRPYRINTLTRKPAI